MKNNNDKFKILLTLTVLFYSCASDPKHNSISFELSDKYKEANDKKWKIAEPNDTTPKGKWWEVFNDPILNQFEENLEHSNQNIQVALSQFEQAQALIAQASSAYGPSIAVSGGAVRQRQAANKQQPQASYSNSFQSSINASWIPDLWGAVRHNVDANRAAVQASAAQLENTKLALQTSLAQSYFSVRILDHNQQIFTQIIDCYNTLNNITAKAKNVGIASSIDYETSNSQLEQAKIQLSEIKISRSQYEHAIAVLLGKPPSEFTLEPQKSKITIPEIPLLLPSRLLERRPDIAQAERLVAQANSQIGLAEAGYFPDFTFSTSAGFSKTDIDSLFSLPSLFWSLGVNLTETIFDNGLRAAKVRAAEANYQVTVAKYRQTVLGALQNVEDILASIRNIKTEQEFQNSITDRNKIIEEIILTGFNLGKNSYQEVMRAQINLLQAQKSVIDLLGRNISAHLNLIAALGGVWSH